MNNYRSRMPRRSLIGKERKVSVNITHLLELTKDFIHDNREHFEIAVGDNRTLTLDDRKKVPANIREMNNTRRIDRKLQELVEALVHAALAYHSNFISGGDRGVCTVLDTMFKLPEGYIDECREEAIDALEDGVSVTTYNVKLDWLSCLVDELYLAYIEVFEPVMANHEYDKVEYTIRRSRVLLEFGDDIRILYFHNIFGQNGKVTAADLGDVELVRKVKHEEDDDTVEEE